MFGEATGKSPRRELSLTYPPMKRYFSLSTVVTAALLALGCLWLNSCNTIAGAGRDVQSAGSAVTRAAN